MGIPLATTMITITRSSNDGTVDLYDQPSAATAVATGVRAVVTAPTSRTSLVKGQRIVTSAGFRADPCDVQTGDVLTDATSGVSYEVLWALSRYELGLGYTYGDLLIVEGAPS